MVGMPGLEPGTSSLSEKRSNQLSYTPVVGIVSILPEISNEILSVFLNPSSQNPTCPLFLTL